jgi:hypothetical protein
MSDQALAVQGAIYNALADAGPPLSDLIEGRVYDRVPVDASGKVKAVFPYITIRDAATVDAGADCIDAEDVSVTIHIWSRSVGSVEAKQIGGAIKTLLDRATLAIGTGFALVEVQWLGAQFFLDPDGLTTHGVVSVLAMTESTAD